LNLIEELEYEIAQAESHLPKKSQHESPKIMQDETEIDKENLHPNTLSETCSDHNSSTVLIDTSTRQEIISNIFYRDKLPQIPKIPQKKTKKPT
jgi:hypothetical protein